MRPEAARLRPPSSAVRNPRARSSTSSGASASRRIVAPNAERAGRRHRHDASHRELLVAAELVAGVGPLAGEQDDVAMVERVGPDGGGQVGRQPEQLLGGHAGNAHLGQAHVERRRRGPHLDLHLLEGPGGEGDDLTGLGQRRLVEVDVDGFAAVEAQARVEHLLAGRRHGLQQREPVGRHRFGQRDPEPLAGDGVEPHDPPVGAGVAVDGVGRAILGGVPERLTRRRRLDLGDTGAARDGPGVVAAVGEGREVLGVGVVAQRAPRRAPPSGRGCRAARPSAGPAIGWCRSPRGRRRRRALAAAVRG